MGKRDQAATNVFIEGVRHATTTSRKFQKDSKMLDRRALPPLVVD
jgi:hypothetical protein